MTGTMWALVAVWALCGVLAGAMAVGRERDGAVWMIAGFFLGPIAILALLMFGHREEG